MLTISDLEVYYRDFKALDIDREINILPKDRVGVIGSNGAGKSTFIKACLGMLPYQGKILSDVAPSQMAVHMQDNQYVETMSLQSIMEAMLKTKVKDNERLQNLIKFFNFETQMKKKFNALSGGQKQRFTLIMVLMQDAPVTFFDEVTTGLDFETRQALIEKISEWYQDKESVILFVTHYYEELQKLTNKLLILNQGKVVDFGKIDDLFKKYCGFSVITLEKNGTHDMEWIKDYKTILAPKGGIAIACKDAHEELEVIQIINQMGINFRRSNNDIEIVSMNAIGGFYD